MGIDRWPNRRVQIAAAASLALVACGRGANSGNVSPGSCGQPEDGSRLEALYITGDDNSREYLDLWYDTGLGTYCRFQVTSDGQTRCLSADRSVAGSFLDGDCSQASVEDYRPACLMRARGIPRYAIRIVSQDECSEEFRLFSLGAGSSPPSIFVRNADGVCAATPNTDSLAHFPVGDEVPLASLVAANVQRRGARLQTPYAIGEDGSRGRATRLVDRVNLFDSQLGVDCDMQTAADGVVRCLPATARAVLASGGFADSQCTRRIAIDDRYACERAALATPEWTSAFESVAVPDSCPDPAKVHVYRLGPSNVPDTTYISDPGSTTIPCLTVANTAGLSVFPVADEIPAAAFVSISLQDHVCGPTRTSGARIKAMYQTSEDGLRMEGGFWFDSKLGAGCSFRTAADGRVRCMPDNQAVFGAEFSDPACGHLVARAEPCPAEDQDLAGEPIFAVRDRDSTNTDVDSCFFESDDWRVHVHRLGARVALATVYQRASDGVCAPAPLSNPSLPPTFYEIGDELSPTEFVGGTYRQP